MSVLLMRSGTGLALCLLLYNTRGQMDISLAFNEIQQVAKDFHQTYGGSCQLASRETILLMPTMIGQGYLRGINLREGLDLFIYEYDLNCDLILDFQKLSLDNSFGNLSFCVSGHCSGSMPGIKDKIHVSSWQTTFSTVPYATGTIELLADRKICVVELVMAPMFAMTVVERELNAMPGDWQIGRASCRERVQISVVAVSLKKKKNQFINIILIEKIKPSALSCLSK